ncbi:hypothetical protein SAMN05444722_2221 [Rhodovulum sp. ES.010]|uniref:hypothetical protein n=1 Tax=Rhodovulum sp. ES.010 TaxID=1882821 RepID=UPI000926DE00|nr:hypothetical protein [Rhodovulum sp. ES.010]SIO44871.1 hypothetical protein SAMN05444722_2221 [Rhodovulum sp. ES.010]
MTEKGDIIPPNQSGPLVDLRDLPTDALRALIDRLNKKSQTATRIFEGEYEIKIEDLKRLLDQIRQEFAGSTKLNVSASATILTSKNRKFDFSTWEEFETFDTSQPENTRSLTVGLIADVLRGEKNDFERFEVEVSIQNNPAQFGIQIGPLGVRPVSGFEVPPAPIVAQVKFPDYILGKNIISTIESWEQALPRRATDFRKRVQKRSHMIRAATVFSTTAAALAACFIIYNFRMEQLSSAFSLPSMLFLGALVTYCLHSTGSFFASQIERNIDRQRPHYNVILTAGDQRKEEQRKIENSKYRMRAIYFALASSAQVLVSLFAEYLARKLF